MFINPVGIFIEVREECKNYSFLTLFFYFFILLIVEGILDRVKMFSSIIYALNMLVYKCVRILLTTKELWEERYVEASRGKVMKSR